MTSDNDDLLIRVSRWAMACEFEVCFPAGSCENGTEFAIAALDRVDAIEAQLSYFLAGSQVGEINRSAARRAVEVEPWLFELLELAVRVCDETAGAYDITSAPLWEVWGFARRSGSIPSDAQLAEARSLVGCEMLELDAARRTVRFRKPGVRINLGSIGKGYAIDVCGGRLAELGMTDFLVHGGQSSVMARGSGRHTADADCSGVGQAASLSHSNGTRSVPATLPWEVGIPHPRRPGQRLAVVRLCDRALGTSGGQFQSFRHRGRRLGHIIDARTGWPAEGVHSATVVAPTAALADALSTAFFVMGPEAALAYCRNRPEIGMVMVCPGGGEASCRVEGDSPRPIDHAAHGARRCPADTKIGTVPEVGVEMRVAGLDLRNGAYQAK